MLLPEPALSASSSSSSSAKALDSVVLSVVATGAPLGPGIMAFGLKKHRPGLWVFRENQLDNSSFGAFERAASEPGVTNEPFMQNEAEQGPLGVGLAVLAPEALEQEEETDSSR